MWARASSLVLAWAGVDIPGHTLMRIELPLDHSLRPRLLADGLMLRVKLHPAGLTDSDHRNILDALHDPKIGLGHEHSLP
jgi:hypothetical protein